MGGGTPYLYFPGRLGGCNLPAVFLFNLSTYRLLFGVASPFDYIAKVSIYFEPPNKINTFFSIISNFFCYPLSGAFWTGFAFKLFFVRVFCAHIIIIRGRVCVCPRAFFSIDGGRQTGSQARTGPGAVGRVCQATAPARIFHAAAHPGGHGRR